MGHEIRKIPVYFVLVFAIGCGSQVKFGSPSNPSSSPEPSLPSGSNPPTSPGDSSVQPPAGGNAQAVQTTNGNESMTCAIVAGKLYCWGKGSFGFGSATSQSSVPVQITQISNWTAVSISGLEGCGIAGGALYCWAGVSTPQQVGSLTTWTAISQGRSDTCGIANGALYCWGANTHGEDGLGNSNLHSTPQRVGQLSNWTAISQTGDDACGIAGGALYCWGSNHNGEDGLGTTTEYMSPQRVGNLTNWTAVSLTNWQYPTDDACGIAGGRLYCWGLSGLGEGAVCPTCSPTPITPTPVNSFTNWTAISVSDGNACGIADGSLYCWGVGDFGQNGLGNTTTFSTPQKVGSLTSWSAVSQSGTNACGIANGALYCWGQNANGEDGAGNTTSQHSPSLITF